MKTVFFQAQNGKRIPKQSSIILSSYRVTLFPKLWNGSLLLPNQSSPGALLFALRWYLGQAAFTLWGTINPLTFLTGNNNFDKKDGTKCSNLHTCTCSAYGPGVKAGLISSGSTSLKLEHSISWPTFPVTFSGFILPIICIGRMEEGKKYCL